MTLKPTLLRKICKDRVLYVATCGKNFGNRQVINFHGARFPSCCVCKLFLEYASSMAVRQENAMKVLYACLEWNKNELLYLPPDRHTRHPGFVRAVALDVQTGQHIGDERRGLLAQFTPQTTGTA
jgi:hypothetical protein